jgi:hypothetical protein
MPRGFSATVLAVLALAAACSSGPNVVPRATGTTELVIAVVVVHGSDTAQQRLLGLPVASVFGDGRLIHPGPKTESNPGPALPALAVTPLDKAGVDALLSAAKDAGLLGADQEERYPLIEDPAITAFVIFAADRRHQTMVEALQEVQADDPRLSPNNLEQREAMKALIALMDDPRQSQSLATHITGDDSAYEPTALRIIVAPAGTNPEPSPLPPAVREWPLSSGLAAFGQTLGDEPNVRCGTVEGDDFATLYPLVRESNQLTLWSSGGVSYALRFRPLLPGESGCG